VGIAEIQPLKLRTMNGLENSVYLTLYIVSNVVAVVLLWASWKNQRLARLLLFLIFAWASWTNWNEALVAPQFYLDYASLTFMKVYKNFINGWFSSHILLSVGFIATCQSLIALSMLLSGWIFKAGCAGAVIFLLAIAPLGVGSAFPCTVIMAVAIVILLTRKEVTYLWLHPKRVLNNNI
jgi:hypothetical protein